METKIQCIIIDDDPISTEVMSGLVAQTEFMELQATFNDPMKASAWLASEETDLILLDVEMPGLTGLQLLSTLTLKPHVIVVSSKEKYALEAFDYSVTDYLLKPVKDYTRFLKAVMKVQEKIKSKGPSGDDSIYIKADSLFTNVPLNDILWVEAFGDFVKINTEKKVFTIYSTMKVLEKKLPPNIFIRVHRSFIINIKKITNIDHFNLQIGKKIIPISTSYKDQLMKSLNII